MLGCDALHAQAGGGARCWMGQEAGWLGQAAHRSGTRTRAAAGMGTASAGPQVLEPEGAAWGAWTQGRAAAACAAAPGAGSWTAALGWRWRGRGPAGFARNCCLWDLPAGSAQRPGTALLDGAAARCPPGTAGRPSALAQLCRRLGFGQGAVCSWLAVHVQRPQAAGQAQAHGQLGGTVAHAAAWRAPCRGPIACDAGESVRPASACAQRPAQVCPW